MRSTSSAPKAAATSRCPEAGWCSERRIHGGDVVGQGGAWSVFYASGFGPEQAPRGVACRIGSFSRWHARCSPLSWEASPAHRAYIMASEKPVTLKDLTILGKENLPSGGGFMILPSQLGYFDLLRLELVLEGREVIYSGQKRSCAPSSAACPSGTGERACHGVHARARRRSPPTARPWRRPPKAAPWSSYLPCEAATMSSPMTTVPGMKLEFLLKAGIPVLPLHVHRRQDTALPIERRYSDAEVIFNFGRLLQGTEANLATYQERLLLLSEQSIWRALPLARSQSWLRLDSGLQKARHAQQRR
jgi:hypothetical protein